MQHKNTDELKQELMEKWDLDQFLSENHESFTHHTVEALVNDLLQKKGISKAVLAKNSAMSDVYLYQVLSGKRNPSRNRILCLCFGLTATLEESQELLRQCGLAQLYPRRKRDAIIMYGLLHGMTLFDVNDKLFQEDEEALY